MWSYIADVWPTSRLKQFSDVCSRPRGSQIGAVVSHQSSVLKGGQQELQQKQHDLEQVSRCLLHSSLCICIEFAHDWS